METECYICHNPKASENSMIAPPMIAVKKHYIDSNTTKKEFIASLILWVNDPEAPSKMPGAQKRFGKMPYLPYSVETITQIAAYVYDNEIEKPKWFDAHYEGEHGKGKGKRKGMGMGMGMGKHKTKASQEPETDLADIGLGYALANQSYIR